MILLTVGTQLPFDRLVEAVDGFAAAIGESMVAQICRGTYIPSHMEWHRVIEPVQFENLVASASLVVSHAGIGTILTARQHLKPLVLFPRLASLGEHRNDHQLATTAALAGRPGIAIATRIDELRVYLETPPRSPTEANAPASQRQLCDTIVDFIKQAQVEGSRHV